MIRILLLFVLLCLSLSLSAQDTLVLSKDNLNKSIANQFEIYESAKHIECSRFLETKEGLPKKSLLQKIENLDFTSSSHFIHFIAVNPNQMDIDIILETARPITNLVELYDVKLQTSQKTGDALNINEKKIKSNNSLLAIHLGANESKEFVLKLSSDGEIISLPIIFWEPQEFHIKNQEEQFFFGIFYGVFLFVIIIYTVFYVLLRDSLFLIYSIYVLFSALMQFALDGYLHEYIFTNGGYWTQHSIIIFSGLTVFFALYYAYKYLALKGKVKRVTQFFGFLVLITILSSLIPGPIYEFCYPLINGLSFILIVYLLTIALKIRQKNKGVSRLFLFGLFSLMIGAILFILGNFSLIDFPELTQNSLKAGALVEIICLSILMAGKYKTLQDQKRKIQSRLFNELKEKSELMKDANIKLEREVKERTYEIEMQRSALKEKNEDILSGIKYAERIQKAILPSQQTIDQCLPDSFVFYRPKDVLSGDFYWVAPVTTSDSGVPVVLFCAADSTGHGVPGAFMSLIGNNYLKLSLSQENVNSPADALNFLNAGVKSTLKQNDSQSIKDGMDIALCAWFTNSNTLYFAGAKNPLYIIKNDELIEIKGDKHPIGEFLNDDQIPFTNHEIRLEGGECLYVFTDGFADQFGGPNGKKFMYRQFKELLLAIHKKPMAEQRLILEKEFLSWKGSESQVDDICIIGVRV